MNDVTSALRTLRASPLVTGVAILSLALGIGANTAMFTIVDRLVLRALPVGEPERLVVLGDKDGQSYATNPIWEQVRDRSATLFDGAFAWSATRFNRAQSGEVDQIDGIWASGRIFEVLRVPAVLGRTFGVVDDRRGGGPDGAVAVISYDYWQRQYGGDAMVLGTAIVLNQTTFTIVGVTAPGFFGPEVGRTFDVIVPLGAEPLVRREESALDQRSWWWLTIMARLKQGQSMAAATTGLQAIQPQVRESTLPTNWAATDLVHYLEDKFQLREAASGISYLRTRYQRPLITIQVVVGLVLLIACGNIANLLLARTTARRHELSVRQALGASRWRLARQLFSESLLLAVAGAALGSIVAIFGGRLLVSELSTQSSRVFLDLGVDWRMLAFTTAIAMATALLFGVLPALRATRVQPIDAMKEQGRGNSSTARQLTLGQWLVVAQVALSLVLVVAAGLFVRTFSTLADLNLGFDQDRVVVAEVRSQRTGVDSTQRMALYDRLVSAAAAVPGVLNASASVVTPVGGSSWNNRASVRGGLPLGPRDSSAYMNLLTPGWFATYGTTFVAGRDFHAGDVRGAPLVAIVNQTFVKKFIGSSNPIGRTLHTTEGRFDTPIDVEIVGVVRDAVYLRLRDTIPATMYFPLAQQPSIGSDVSVSVRVGTGYPGALMKSLSAAINGAQANLSTSFRTLASQVHDALQQERLVAVLSAFFGGLALLLAALGLYGVTMYSVNMRRAELGIRMALGSPPTGVMGLVLRRVAWQVGVGIVAGTLIAWWLSRTIAALLYGLAPTDPLTMGGAALVLAVVGMAAGLGPARKAARLDPLAALREG